MNKLQRMGKTNFEVIKMKKTNHKDTFPLRKYYGIMLSCFVLFLGIMAYYSVSFKEKRQLAKQEIKLDQSVGAADSVSQGTEKTTESTVGTTQEKTGETTKTSAPAALHYDGKRKLSWPVTGNILLPYSMKSTIYFESLDQYRTNPGIMIEAREGTVVKSVKRAKVLEVYESAEYGKMVRADLGDGYEIRYGQMKNIEASPGDILEKGQVIGKVAAPTDYYTLEGCNLYVQLEKDKKSVDPMKYLE